MNPQIPTFTFALIWLIFLAYADVSRHAETYYLFQKKRVHTATPVELGFHLDISGELRMTRFQRHQQKSRPISQSPPEKLRSRPLQTVQIFLSSLLRDLLHTISISISTSTLSTSKPLPLVSAVTSHTQEHKRVSSQ